jgi:hypothetical protein
MNRLAPLKLDSRESFLPSQTSHLGPPLFKRNKNNCCNNKKDYLKVKTLVYFMLTLTVFQKPNRTGSLYLEQPLLQFSYLECGLRP